MSTEIMIVAIGGFIIGGISGFIAALMLCKMVVREWLETHPMLKKGHSEIGL